ncbi:MAG: YceI family protein [Massilia sp.]
MKKAHIIVLAAFVAGCATQLAPPPAPAPVPVPVDAPTNWYQQAEKAGQNIYRIDAAQSLITVVVRRGGALARLGHDHVVASHTLEGFVAPDAGRADFQFRLDQMSVDEGPLRTAAGLDTQPSADAIAGTRVNMLTKVLDADRFPVVLLHVERSDAPDTLRLTVTLHGVARSYQVPTRIVRTGDSLTATGDLRLLQTDFGIVPMSVMGGAMSVLDPMELHFSIVARAGKDGASRPKN